MADKKKPSPFDYLDAFVLANAITKVSLAASVVTTAIAVRTATSLMRKKMEKRRRRRFLR